MLSFDATVAAEAVVEPEMACGRRGARSVARARQARWPGWVPSLVAALLAVVSVIFGSAPASAAPAPYSYDTVAYSYDATTPLSTSHASDGAARASQAGPGVASLVESVSFRGFGVAANTGNALVKYDADFAVGQLTAGGRATASQLDEFGAAQGWARSQTATGPVKYTDGNGVVRLTIKQGSPRTPGSGGPHVELRNPGGTRIDPFGNPVSRTSPGNHTPIVWDW